MLVNHRRSEARCSMGLSGQGSGGNTVETRRRHDGEAVRWEAEEAGLRWEEEGLRSTGEVAAIAIIQFMPPTLGLTLW
ncbi:hypothetical protein R6Q59_014403 [Mikania micrantha]